MQDIALNEALDLEMVNEGLEYATNLINDICGGSFSKNVNAGNLEIRKEHNFL
jgi:phenylalanyl-tRNA synthetase beta subunit